jgi:hypothetical protein
LLKSGSNICHYNICLFVGSTQVKFFWLSV